MTGKEFEKLCMDELARESKAGRADMGRYGVQGSFAPDRKNPDGPSIWQPIESLPDFEGVIPPLGRQFITDTKVCQASSFNLSRYRAKGPKSRQLKHMFRRQKFGVTTFFLIHWPKRVLSTKTDPVQTWAFPVAENHPFWKRFLTKETTSLTRRDCERYAVRVSWGVAPRCRVERPQTLDAVLVLMTHHIQWYNPKAFIQPQDLRL